MPLARSAASLVPVVVLLAACGRAGGDGALAERTFAAGSVAEQGPDPAHVLFGCLEGDSAVYSAVVTDSAAGVTITLWQAGDGIDGAAEWAVDPGGSVPLAGLRLGEPDSVSLDMIRGADRLDTTFLAGRVDCESLRGTHRTSRDGAPREASFRRVR